MTRRTDQVADEIRRQLGELLQREVRDPRVGFATVTGVDLSSDLQHARVHVSVLGSPEEEAETMEALQKASGFLRTQLGRRMRMRHIPSLRFEADSSARHAMRISELLSEVQAPQESERAPHDKN